MHEYIRAGFFFAIATVVAASFGFATIGVFAAAFALFFILMYLDEKGKTK